MVWMTWWPLILGFTLAGLIQSSASRDALRHRLGRDSPSSLARSTLLGVISSSCSYAATAMARALFARGASWRNSLVFMIASTNLVIELGIVLYIVLGWRFLVAELAGGGVMIMLLALFTRVGFSHGRVEHLRRRVLDEEPPASSVSSHRHLLDRETLTKAARFTVGDLTMIRVELVAGFFVAGFLSVHVPATWWSHLFVSGHGEWTILLDVLLAPLVAVIACVCSVGNIPFAATLWAHGVAFGGVIAFIFADLITLPVLAIYRRFYGAANAWRLFALLWFAMSLAGLTVDGLFRLGGLVPNGHHVRILSGQFPLGATLGLNVLATVVLLLIWWLARTSPASATIATDPVCGMSVDVASAPASAQRDGSTYYFCSPRCRDRFAREDGSGGPPSGPETFTDPVCGMSVTPGTDDSPVVREGVAYYFCCEGCRTIFTDAASPSQPIE